jgi:carboxymethylenebutenolidase
MLMPIATPEKGLSTSRPELSAGDFEMHGYFAAPEGKERLPGVLVIHEAFGVTAHIEDVVRRFAKAGFATVAMNLFGGQPAPRMGDMPALFKLLGAFDEQDAVDHLAAATDWLSHHPRCTGKVGAVGYCMGGRLAMLLACETNKLSAVAPYYGSIVNRPFPGAPPPPAGVRKIAPLDVADKLSCPLQGHYGGKDQSITVDDVHALEKKLEGKSAALFIYPEAAHAFHNDQREAYNEAAASQAFNRTIDFFKKELAS